MHTSRFAFPLASLPVLFCLAAMTCLSPAAEQTYCAPPRSQNDEFRNWGEVKKEMDACAARLARPDAAATIVKYLLDARDQDVLYARLMGLGYGLDREKRTTVAGEVFDELRKKDDLSTALLAADVLLRTIMGTTSDGFGTKEGIIDFPDALCERAAALLDYPDPVVQAMAEWMLALRFKKQNRATSYFSCLLQPEDRKKLWFQKWWNRKADRFLTDDYCRQLVQLDRHRTLDGLRTEVGKIEERMGRLLKVPDSDAEKAREPQAAYRDALAAIRAAVAKGDLLAAHQAYPKLRSTAREVIVACRPEFPREGVAFMTNYRIPGGDWNVNMPVTNATNMPCGDIYWKKSADPADEAVPFGLQKKLGDGSVRGIDLSWETDKILFSYWHQPIDPKVKPHGWDTHKNAFIYELNVASGAIKQLTKSPGDNDIEPCFLPDGGYVFASDRSSFGNQCAGPFIQDKRCTTLFRIDPRRSEKPVAISNNKDFDRYPHVLNDGTIVFMHWEYQERDLYNSHTAWRCRPDGTNMDAFYKQHIAYPMSIRDVRQAPESQVCVATAQGHHDSHCGPVIVFNPTRGINNPEAMQLVTPGVASVEGGLGPLYAQVVPEGGVENRGGSYINPFPMSEKAFLVGHDMEGVGLYKTSKGMNEFSIYYIDGWGNRELIHRDKEMSCFAPHPLRPRKRPMVVADTVDPKATCATAFVEDVYRDLPGVKKGAVKYLRISQRLMLPAPVDYDDPDRRFNHLHWQPGDSTSVHFGYWTFAPTRTVGFVKVEDDGSAYFKVPAGTPVFLQALDENYCEVRRMRTSFTLQRGEFRSCNGCHESRYETAGSRSSYPRATLEKGPLTPVPPAWGDCTVQDFRRDIQPIFDKHCVKCHGEKEPKWGLDLTGRPVGGFTQSYRSLFGIKPGDPQIVNDLALHKDLHPEAANEKYISGKEAQKAIKLMQQSQYPGQLVYISNKNSRDADVTQPYQFGTNKSKLIRKLLDDKEHRANVRSKIAPDEWLALVTWIDHNANFHSTLMDKSKYQRENKVARVPYYLPDPWTPADLNPSFYNRKNSAIVPDERPGK